MLTLTISLDSLAFYIVVADIVLLLLYILYIKHNARQLHKTITGIAQFIADYFRNSGTEVQVTCIKHTDGRRFIVMVESEPLKRFRYSNILESNLINHIYKSTGNMVEKIYWRFPVQLTKDTVLTYEGTDLAEDIYFAEHAKLKDQANYGVSEVSWDEFEKAKPGDMAGA